MQNWKRPLMCRPEQEVAAYLAEVRALGDRELWEEVSAKLCDALVVYRQSLRARTFTFSDGITRNIDAMAQSHARAQVAEEFGDEANLDVL